MGRSNNSFIKKQKADKRIKKRQDKLKKRTERKKNSAGGDLDSMMAYVDEYGNISTEPPEVDQKEEVDQKKSENQKK